MSQKKDIKNDEYGYVKFTGDYSKLKSMGFTFQKLYAGNYMQWCRNHLRVWKKGSDITHDSYDLFKLIRFLRTNPELRDYTTGSFGAFKFYSNADENIYDYYPFTEENIKRYRDNMELWSSDKYDKDNPPPYLGSMCSISKDVIADIKEFESLGWLELDWYPED